MLDNKAIFTKIEYSIVYNNEGGLKMSKIIAVIGEKGGTGKSTTAQALAVYFGMVKKQDTIVVDADPQGTTEDWADIRNENKAATQVNIIAKKGNIRHTLIELAKKYAYVVVDCGGQDSEAMRSSLVVCDLAILTFRPKRRDLKTLLRMEKIVKDGKALNERLICRALITQCPALPNQSSRVVEAKAVCNTFEIQPLDSITLHRNAYDDCEEKGLTVIEFEDQKAKDEMLAVCNEVWGILNVKA